MLFTAGASQRLGRVDDGSAVTDYDDEEIARQMSISTGVAFAEWSKTKINLLDTPGFNMFVHEAKMVLPAVEAALVVVDGVSGVEVVTERVWGYCEEANMPRVIVVSRMDRERADANRVLESLTKSFGRGVTPLQLRGGACKVARAPIASRPRARSPTRNRSRCTFSRPSLIPLPGAFLISRFTPGS